MIIDANFWVAVSFFIFLGVLIYFKIPQRITTILDDSINTIKTEVDNAELLKEESKNILSEYEKKISNAKIEVKQMIHTASDDADVVQLLPVAPQNICSGTSPFGFMVLSEIELVNIFNSKYAFLSRVNNVL